MSILNVVKYPDNTLEKKCADVLEINEEVLMLLDDMYETMVETNGVGLAAPQIGVLKNMVVISVDDEKIFKMINPKIISHSDEKILWNEGCLSVPGVYSDVERFAEVEVEYTNIYGNLVRMHADNLLSVCIQHELDHLNGVLFIDRIDSFQRNRVMKDYLAIRT